MWGNRREPCRLIAANEVSALQVVLAVCPQLRTTVCGNRPEHSAAPELPASASAFLGAAEHHDAAATGAPRPRPSLRSTARSSPPPSMPPLALAVPRPPLAQVVFLFAAPPALDVTMPNQARLPRGLVPGRRTRSFAGPRARPGRASRAPGGGPPSRTPRRAGGPLRAKAALHRGGGERRGGWRAGSVVTSKCSQSSPRRRTHHKSSARRPRRSPRPGSTGWTSDCSKLSGRTERYRSGPC